MNAKVMMIETIDTAELNGVYVASLWPPAGALHRHTVAIVPLAGLPEHIAEHVDPGELFTHNGELCQVLGEARQVSSGGYEPAASYDLQSAKMWTELFRPPAVEVREAEALCEAKLLAELDKQHQLDAQLEAQRAAIAEESRINTRKHTLHTKDGYLDRLESTIAALTARVEAMEKLQGISGG